MVKVGIVFTMVIAAFISVDTLNGLNIRHELEETSHLINQEITHQGGIDEELIDYLFNHYQIVLTCENSCRGSYGDLLTYSLSKRIDSWLIFLNGRQIVVSSSTWIGYN